MKIAFFSPLNPQCSGISDYSEALLPHLAAETEIDLFVEGFAPTNAAITSRFRILDYRRDPRVLNRLPEYDAALYHMGNDHRYHSGICDVALAHPGILVLHDFALHHFFYSRAQEAEQMNYYLAELEACSGRRARLEAEEAIARGVTPRHLATPTQFPLNCRLVKNAEAVIVHSDWSRTRLARIAPTTPVKKIPHLIFLSEDDAKLNHLAQPPNATMQIGSFGLITPDKGIERALRALARLRERFDFQYTLVGETNPYFDVRAIVRELNLQDRVTITGRVTIDEFVRRIAETDIAINLRERTVGETSGSLCRIMAAGVASVVSNAGWFAEIPNDCAVKIDTGAHADALLEAYLARLIEDKKLRAALGRNARQYVFANHRIEHCAAQYLEFIRETVMSRARRHFVNRVAAEIARIGINPADEKVLQKVAAEINALAPAKAAIRETNGERQRDLSNGERQNAPSFISSSFAESLTADDVRAATADVSKIRFQANVEKTFEKQNALVQTVSSNGGARNETAARNSSPGEERNLAAALNVLDSFAPDAKHKHGRLPKLEGLDYEQGALEYVRRLDQEQRYYLYTKPFYNLANKPPKHTGDGMDAETHRHFCDFANMAVALALPAGSRILDVGCGSGWLSEFFARMGYDVTGIDISPELIEISKERVARVAYDVDPQTKMRCRFLVQNVERGALDEEFDALICYDSLHHFVDERAVMRNLARMTKKNGLLFILEGDKPPDSSPTADELREVMQRFATLESPFHPKYLRALLDEHGFAVIGDYVSVNGLFERGHLTRDNRLAVQIEPVNYLLCKKVCEDASASTVPDSRAPNRLTARLTVRRDAKIKTGDGEFVGLKTVVGAGESVYIPLEIENTGDTLWRVSRPARRGMVTIGIKIFDAHGKLVSETHGEPPLPRAMAPGETAQVVLKPRAPEAAGRYTIKIDLVSEHVCWFEERGSQPLMLEFQAH
jgi:2-polyprenyl-3-methyl-5-hydroxy-6-metoxy-1,4-benzoquinol methylase/glycosyltransferase involved in cell wall biosynthesis